MKFLFALSLACIAVLSLGTTAFAGELELGLHGGASSHDLNGTAGASVGYQLTQHLVLEGDYDAIQTQKEWTTVDPATQKTIHHLGQGPGQTFTGNIRLDGPSWNYLRPYLLAGGGYQLARGRDTAVYDYGGGLRFLVSDHFDLDMRFRQMVGSPNGDPVNFPKVATQAQHGLFTFGALVRF